MKADILSILKSNSYPGRGIIVGTESDGKSSVAVYFIMGRSKNSRNRIFTKCDDGINIMPFGKSEVTDTSLTIYRPVCIYKGDIVITNGDQTDTIIDFLRKGSSFHAALQTREFEPDAPNYTPRISALLKKCGGYEISILKVAAGNHLSCQRNFFEYSAMPGLGHFISTYEKDGNPLPSYRGEPIMIDIDDFDEIDEFADSIWNVLNSDNKVSLYAMKRDIESGAVSDVIINKNVL